MDDALRHGVPERDGFDARRVEEIFVQPGDPELAAGGSPIDVLHVTGAIGWSWPLPFWFLRKTARWSERLRRSGFNARALAPTAILPRPTRADLIDLVETIAPRVVVSRSFTLRGRDLEALALSLPHTVLVQSNHTPNSFMIDETTGSALDWLDSLDAARRNETVYLSTVSRADAAATAPMTREGRVLWLPNPCDGPGPPVRRRDPPADRPVEIGLAGRTNYQKNLKNQIDAIALLGRERRVRTHVFLGHGIGSGMREEMRRYALAILERHGVEARVHEFVGNAVLRRFAATTLDLFLQVTFDESFGYLNWEMMDAGVPTVTGPGIDLTGVETAHPTRILEIVAAMRAILADMPAARDRAERQAARCARENNDVFDATFRRLLGEAEGLRGAS